MDPRPGAAARPRPGRAVRGPAPRGRLPILFRADVGIGNPTRVQLAHSSCLSFSCTGSSHSFYNFDACHARVPGRSPSPGLKEKVKHRPARDRQTDTRTIWFRFWSEDFFLQISDYVDILYSIVHLPISIFLQLHLPQHLFPDRFH